MSIIIRKPTVAEWEKYKDIRLTSLKEFPKAFSSSYEEALKSTTEDWQIPIANSLNNLGSVMFCAYDAENMVGCIVAYWKDRAKTGHIANIGGMYVRIEYQNQGIAKKLFDELLKELQSMNRFRKIKLEVVTDNPAAYNLYKKMGFVETGLSREELLIDGKYYDITAMEKYLSGTTTLS